MRKTVSIAVLLFMVLFVACGGKGDARTETARFVRVSLLLGKVEVQMGKSAFRPARAGMRLGQGDRIRTVGKGSSCQLSTPGGSVVRMGEGSLLVMARLYRDGKLKIEKTGFQLLVGRVIVRAKKLLSREEFSVRTRGATAGVRGTEFMVSVDEGSNTRVAVKHGSVMVRRVLDIKGAGNKEVKDALEKDSTVLLKPAQQVVVKQDDNRKLVQAAETVLKSDTGSGDTKIKPADLVARVRKSVAQKRIAAQPAPAVFNIQAEPELLKEFNRVETPADDSKAPDEKKQTVVRPRVPARTTTAPVRKKTPDGTVRPAGSGGDDENPGGNDTDEAALRRKRLLEERRKKMEAARKKALEDEEALRNRKTYDDRR